MAISKTLMSAFDRLGQQGNLLGEIADNTSKTSETLSVGGDLYGRIDHLVKVIEGIESGKALNGGLGIKEALTLNLVGAAMSPIGSGLELIVKALNQLPDGKEAGEKMEAITKGLVILGDVGKSILAFAGYMVLATPLLLITAAASPIIGIALFATVTAVMMATKGLKKKQLEKIEMLKGVGLGILAFTASLALSSLIIVPAIKGALGSAVVLGIMGVIFALFPEKVLDKMTKAKDTFLMLGLGIFAIMGAFALSGLIGAMALKGAFFAGLAIVIIGGAFYLLDKLGVIESMEEGGKALLYVAGAILGLGIALALFNIIAPPLPVLLEVAMVVGAVGLVFGIMGSVFGKSIQKGAISLIFAAGAIVVLGLALFIFGNVVGNITGEEAAKSLGALLLIGLIGAGFYLAGTQAPVIAMGAGAMILAGVSIIVLALGVKILSKALEGGGYELIGQIGTLVGGLGLAMAAAGAAAILIAPGAAAMILAGGALIAIGAGVKALSKLDSKTLFGSGGLFGASGQMTSPPKILRIVGIKPRPKTNLEVMLESIADSFSLNPISIASMYLGAPALIMAGAALLSIGAGIRDFQKLVNSGADLPTLKDNIRNIVSSLSDEFARVGNEHGGSGFLGLGGGDVYKGIMATRGMGKSLTGIARGVQAMANLKFPTGFDKDGNPTGFETIDLTSAIPNLVKNTKEIISGLSSVFAEIGGNEAAKGGSWFSSSPYEKGIKIVKKMGEPLANLATGVQNMANLKFPTGYDSDGNPTGYKSIGGDITSLIDAVKNNTKLLITGLAGVFQEIGGGDAQVGGWWKGTTTFDKGVEVAMALGEPFGKLAKAAQDAQKVMDFTFDEASLKSKTKAMVAAFLMMGMVVQGQSLDMDDTAEFVEDITKSYSSMAKSMPKITDAINGYNIEQGDAFAKNMIMIGGGPDATEKVLLEKRMLWKAIGHNMTLSAEAMPEISDAINDMDLAKVTEARQMFEALAVLGQGGAPEDILASMGESLETALQNLANMLEEFKSTVGDGMNATAESGGLLAGAVDGIRSAFSGTPASGGGDNAEVVIAIRQLNKALTSNGVKIKNIDDLI